MQGEFRTKGLCSSEDPLPSSSHLPSDCAILWDCVSADTGSSGGISVTKGGRKKITFSWLWLHSRRTTYFRLCNLDFLILLLWLGGAWSLLMWQRLIWHRRTSSQENKKSACSHQQKVVLELLLLTTLHRPGLSQSRTASNWQLFQRGRWRQCRCACLPSAVRMSISAALK